MPSPKTINVVVDLYHNESMTKDDLKAFKAAGIVAIIHKATNGYSGTDPKFKERKKLATDAGFLWGAYAFGVGASGIDQADHFLSVADPKTDLISIDFEHNPYGESMTLEQVEEFVTHIKTATGHYPLFYSGDTVKQALKKHGFTKPDQTVISNCDLWLAQYGPTPVVPPIWKDWTLWQYTDGAVGPQPHNFGDKHTDRNLFTGTLTQFKNLWP